MGKTTVIKLLAQKMASGELEGFQEMRVLGGNAARIKDPQELNERLKTLTPTEYHQMKENAKRLAKELNSGHFLRQALQEYFTSEV